MPRVSPNKSWEGAVAGFVFAVSGMIAARELVLDFLTMRDAVAIGFIVGLFGQIGDLIESLLKRDTHVKDSSSIIPGHGGILDRFDSLLFTAPIVYLYLTFFTK
jgi:phosphatidate cytidylyltransferase